MTSTVRSVGLKTVSLGLGGFLMMVLSILLTRSFGKERYALLVLTFSVTNIVSGLSELGLRTALTRFLPPALRDERRERIAELLRSSALLQGVGALAIGVALFLLARPLALRFFRYPELVGLLRVGAVYAVAIAMVDSLLVLFQSLERWRRETALYVAFAGLYLVLSLVAVRGFGWGLESVLWSGIIASAVTCIVGIRLLPGPVMAALHGTLEPGSLVRACREMIRFGGPLTVVNLNFMLMMWFDKIWLGRYVSAGEVTCYYIGFLGISVLMVSVRALFAVLLPVLSRTNENPPEVLARRFRQLLWRFLLLGVVSAAVSFVLVKPAIERLYGPGYGQAVWAFRWMLIFFLLRTAYQPVAMFMVNVFDRTGLILGVSTLHAVLLVTLNVLLIPRFGVGGAITANAAAYVGAWIASLASCQEIRRLFILHANPVAPAPAVEPADLAPAAWRGS